MTLSAQVYWLILPLVGGHQCRLFGISSRVMATNLVSFLPIEPVDTWAINRCHDRLAADQYAGLGARGRLTRKYARRLRGRSVSTSAMPTPQGDNNEDGDSLCQHQRYELSCLPPACQSSRQFRRCKGKEIAIKNRHRADPTRPDELDERIVHGVRYSPTSPLEKQHLDPANQREHDRRDRRDAGKPRFSRQQSGHGQHGERNQGDEQAAGRSTSRLSIRGKTGSRARPRRRRARSRPPGPSTGGRSTRSSRAPSATRSGA